MVSNALLEVNTLQTCNEMINLGEEEKEIKKAYKHNRRRNGIVGNNKEMKLNGKQVNGVPRFSNLHVYRLDPSLTENDLCDVLKPFFPEV